MSCPGQDFKPRSSSSQPSHYTDYTMRAPNENVYALFNKEKFHFISEYAEQTVLTVPCSVKRDHQSTYMTFSMLLYVNYY